MTVGFRADAELLNATAGTSVVVSKPTGTVDGDVLIAFVGEVGVGSISTPAGWTLIGSQASGSLMTVAAFRKVAASEPASWTWTLGASVRNFGWVGAFTGVDTSSPLVGFSSVGGNSPIEGEDIAFLPWGMLVQCGGAVQPFAGSQLIVTSELDTGLLDNSAPATAFVDVRSTMGTNTGSGTDIAGTIATYTAPWNVDRLGREWGDRWLSDVTTTARIAWNVSLRPALVAAFDGGLPDTTIEAAFGGDPDDPTTWVWADVSADVWHETGIRISSGRTSQATVANPTEISLTFLSHTGTYHPENPVSSRYPNIRDGLPVRVTVPYGYAPTSLRGIGFARVFRPDWDESTNWSIVRTAAYGRLEQGRRGQTARSPLWRSTIGNAANGYVTHAYWPMEDGSSATSFASAISGHPAMVPSGSVTFADSQLAGSSPLPTFSSGASAFVTVPPYVEAGIWVVQFAMKVPVEPSVETVYAEILSSGTARFWRVSIEPGTPETVHLKLYDSSEALIVGYGTQLAGGTVGKWVYYLASSEDAGANYEASFGASDTGDSAGFGSVEAGSHGTLLSINPKGGNGSAHGHYGVWVDPAFNTTTDTTGDALLGWAREAHPERFLRLHREENIPRAASYLRPTTYTGDAMGAQPVQDFGALANETEVVDSGGFIHDSRGPEGEVILDLRADRYNQPIAMTIDMEQKQLHAPYAPQLDNQRRRTTSTVSLPDGTSATYEKDIGRGKYRDPVTINLADGDMAKFWAQWRVALGTQTGMRFPQIAINLRRNPSLVPDFCDLRVGHTIRVTNPPSQQAPDDIDLIVEGIDEFISADTWKAVLHCSPAKIYQQIGIWGTGRWDTAASQLKTAVNSTATSFDVAVTSGPLWTTDDAQDGFDWEIGGERVTVTDIATSTITAGAAGTADHDDNTSLTPGLPASLAAGDLMVLLAAIRNSGTGVPSTPSGWTRLDVFPTSSNVQLFAKIAGSSETSPTVSFTGGVLGASTSAQIVRLVGKWHDADSILIGAASCLNESAQNITYPGLQLPSADNAIILYVGWKQDDWTSVATISGATEIGEPDTTTGDDQGIVWDRVIQTTAASIPSGVFTVTGGVSAISRGAVVALRCDYQTATVTRSVNGVVKSQVAGEAINLWTPMRWGL